MLRHSSAGIGDSRVGLAAWLLDHDAASYALTARVFDGQREALTRDDLLDNLTLYWLTNTTGSSATRSPSPAWLLHQRDSNPLPSLHLKIA